MFSLNVVLDEFAISSLRALPLINPFLTAGGWQVEESVSVGLKYVRT